MYFVYIPIVLLVIGFGMVIVPEIITFLLKMMCRFGESSPVTTYSLFVLIAFLMVKARGRKNSQTNIFSFLEKMALMEFILVLANERLERLQELWLTFCVNHENSLKLLCYLGSITVAFAFGAIIFSFLLIRKLAKKKKKAPIQEIGKTKKVIPISTSNCPSVELKQFENMKTRR